MLTLPYRFRVVVSCDLSSGVFSISFSETKDIFSRASCMTSGAICLRFGCSLVVPSATIFCQKRRENKIITLFSSHDLILLCSRPLITYHTATASFSICIYNTTWPASTRPRVIANSCSSQQLHHPCATSTFITSQQNELHRL